MNKRLEELAEQANMLIVAGIDVWEIYAELVSWI